MEEILHQLVTIGNYEALFTSWDHNGMFTIYQLIFRISQLPSTATVSMSG